ETTAAGSEQCVTTKEIITEQISDMSRGVARNEKDFSSHLANDDLVSLINAARESRNPSLITLVTVDLETLFRQQPFVPAGMVTMMVGVENCRELDFLEFDTPQNRFGFGGIDNPRGAGFLADDKIAVIVPKQWNLNDFHDRFFLCSQSYGGCYLRNIGFCLTVQSKNNAGMVSLDPTSVSLL